MDRFLLATAIRAYQLAFELYPKTFTSKIRRYYRYFPVDPSGKVGSKAITISD